MEQKQDALKEIERIKDKLEETAQKAKTILNTTSRKIKEAVDDEEMEEALTVMGVRLVKLFKGLGEE